jgi:hypothetical protein
MMRLWTQLLMVVFLASAAYAQSPKNLWVLQEPDEIAEYDLVLSTVRRTIKVPHRLHEHPEYLSINGKGQMLFHPPHGIEWLSGEMTSAGHRVWFWDGHQANEWKLEIGQIRGSSASKPTLTETKAQCYLSAGGEFLFWFENKFEKVTDKSGLERSVRTSSRVWRTNLVGSKPEAIASLSLPGWCQCETGSCPETCPEFSFWAPEGVVSDFFLLTRFTPGQLGPTYHESLLYQRSGQKWLGKKLVRPIEDPLDASEKGEILVAAVPDGGCCGWDNDSDNQTLLLHKGKVSILYDEFDRYGNRDYDVSFYTANARLAPGNRMLAYTIVSTVQPGSDIRLSSDGKENIEELERIHKTIGEIPAVEIVHLGTAAQSKTSIRYASLVGWLSEREILVAQDGRLMIFDTLGNKRRETTIRVRSAADAFLR